MMLQADAGSGWRGRLTGNNTVVVHALKISFPRSTSLRRDPIWGVHERRENR